MPRLSRELKDSERAALDIEELEGEQAAEEQAMMQGGQDQGQSQYRVSPPTGEGLTVAVNGKGKGKATGREEEDRAKRRRSMRIETLQNAAGVNPPAEGASSSAATTPKPKKRASPAQKKGAGSRDKTTTQGGAWFSILWTRASDQLSAIITDNTDNTNNNHSTVWKTFSWILSLVFLGVRLTWRFILMPIDFLGQHLSRPLHNWLRTLTLLLSVSVVYGTLLLYWLLVLAMVVDRSEVCAVRWGIEQLGKVTGTGFKQGDLTERVHLEFCQQWRGVGVSWLRVCEGSEETVREVWARGLAGRGREWGRGNTRASGNGDGCNDNKEKLPLTGTHTHMHEHTELEAFGLGLGTEVEWGMIIQRGKDVQDAIGTTDGFATAWDDVRLFWREVGSRSRDEINERHGGDGDAYGDGVGDCGLDWDWDYVSVGVDVDIPQAKENHRRLAEPRTSTTSSTSTIEHHEHHEHHHESTQPSASLSSASNSASASSLTSNNNETPPSPDPRTALTTALHALSSPLDEVTTLIPQVPSCIVALLSKTRITINLTRTRISQLDPRRPRDAKELVTEYIAQTTALLNYVDATTELIEAAIASDTQAQGWIVIVREELGRVQRRLDKCLARRRAAQSFWRTLLFWNRAQRTLAEREQVENIRAAMAIGGNNGLEGLRELLAALKIVRAHLSTFKMGLETGEEASITGRWGVEYHVESLNALLVYFVNAEKWFTG